MSKIDSIELAAASVEEATREALEQLSAREDEVTIEVLAVRRAGVLGLGARQAGVRVTRNAANADKDAASTRASSHAPAPRSERNQAGGAKPDDGGAAARKSAGQEEQRREATVILQQILEKMGERAEVAQVEVDAESVELEIKVDATGIVIGRLVPTLETFESLLNRTVARRLT